MNLSTRDLSNLFGQLGYNKEETDQAISDLINRYGEEPFHLNSFFLGTIINLTKRVKTLELEIERREQLERDSRER